MIRFECDYGEGAHPRILERMVETNMAQTPGYSEDEFCDQARAYIRRACGRDDVDVHFLVGGTQTNMTVIAAALRPYQGAVAAVTGHINVHETGAIEATGHKVLALECSDGKIRAGQIEALVHAHREDSSFEHMVQPGLVYISFPTENGTIYSKKELEEIYKVCCNEGLYLFIDGARLGYGLTCPENDLTMADLARLCDVFYIGGTKVGAMFGEAVVIGNETLKKDFRYMIKQRGGMLAKGRLLGIQFEVLFDPKDGQAEILYTRIARDAVKKAERIRQAFSEKGCKFLYDSPTNQQFPILTDAQLDALKDEFSFTFWQKTADGHNCVRFCTSWATTDAAVDRLIQVIQGLPTFP